MQSRALTVRTGAKRGLFDLTDECRRFVHGGDDGLLVVFLPHATAGLLVMELGAGSEEDLFDVLDGLLPRDDRWRHRHGSRGHGADHILPGSDFPVLLSYETYERTFSWIREVGLPEADVDQILERTAPSVLHVG